MELKKYKLGELLCRIENGAVVKQNKGATGIPITRIETLSKGVFNRDKLGYADIDDPTQYENYILEDNDLLMSHINSKEFVGRTVIYKKQGNECIIHGMNLLRIKTNARLLDSEFAYYFFQTDTIKRYLYNLRKDAIGQSSIAISDIKNMIVSVPNISVQKEIAFALRSYDCKIALNRAINQNLRARREQRESSLSLCRAEAVNGDVSRNLEAIPDRSSRVEGVSRVDSEVVHFADYSVYMLFLTV